LKSPVQQSSSHNPGLQSGLRTAAAWLAGIEFWPVAVLVGAGMLAPALMPFALAAAALFWPLRWLASGRLSAATAADWGVGLLALTIPATLWATALPQTTLPQVLRLLGGMALFYAVVNWAHTNGRLRLLVFGMVAVGLGLAVLAVFGVDWETGGFPLLPAGLYDRLRQLLSDTANPNVMAGYLALILPLGLGLLTFAWRSFGWPARLGLTLAVLAMTGILFLTHSRGAWLACGAALVALIALRWKWGWTIVPLTLLGAGLVVYTFGVAQVMDVITTGGAISGIEGRVEIWSRAIYMIQDFPFTGIGMGSFMRVADLLYPFFLAEPGTIDHAHNLFLQVAVDLGLPGLIAWLSIFGVVALSAWQVYRVGRRVQNGWVAALGAGLLASQLALAVHGLTDAVTWGMVRPAPLVWALWGLAAAAANLFRYDRIPEKRSAT
jgi:putative inorganic carbon (HCO3(-)) transporter